MNSHLFGTWSPTVRHCLTYGLTWRTPVTNGKGVHPQSGHWEGEQFLVFKISPSTATNLSGINAGMDSTPFERDLQSMFLGLWPTRCRSDFVIHSTNNSKKPVAHFSLFFFFFCITTGSSLANSPQYAKKSCYLTSAGMHVCIYSGTCFPSLVQV